MATFTTSDNIRLNYETEGSGPAVLLLHGLSSSIAGNWRQPGIWEQLVSAGRTVHGMDLRGHGQSSKPHQAHAYANGAMARDVCEFAAYLRAQDGGQLDLVGYSLGAMTALRAAASGLGLRKLVLGGIGGDPASWRTNGVASPSRVLSQPAVLAGLVAADDSEVTDPDALRVRQLMSSRGNDLLAIAALLRGLQPGQGGLDLDAVTSETLVICGDADQDPRPLAAALPNATAEVVPGDHESVVNEPLLAKALLTFLES